MTTDPGTGMAAVTTGSGAGPAGGRGQRTRRGLGPPRWTPGGGVRRDGCVCPSRRAARERAVDSGPADDGIAVRRRRECLACGRRFTTQERIVELPLMV